MGLPNKRTGLSPRTYVAVPHDIGTHPDNADLSLEAFGLWTLCLAWAGGEWTDGRLRMGAIRLAAARGEAGWTALVDELVRAGRLEPTDDPEYPYAITKWAKYQMTLAKYQEELAKRSGAGKKGAQAAG